MLRHKQTSLLSNRLQVHRPNWSRLHQLLVFLAVMSAVCLFGLGVYLVFWRWLVIRSLDCYVANQKISESECNTASGLLGKSIVFARLDSAESIQQIQQVAVPDRLIYFKYFRKQLPNKLQLFFEVSKPEYAVTVDQKEWWVVDALGRVKQVSQKPSGVACFFSRAWSQSNPWSEKMAVKEHAFITSWIESARDVGREVVYIGFDDINQVSIIFQDKRRILVTAAGSSQVELERLKLIERELQTNARTQQTVVAEIDLRFKFPVVRFVHD